MEAGLTRKRVESPVLAQRLAAVFDDDVAAVAYEVRIGADGRCPEWVERTASVEIVHDAEPGTIAAQRAWIQFLAILPIEWPL